MANKMQVGKFSLMWKFCKSKVVRSKVTIRSILNLNIKMEIRNELFEIIKVNLAGKVEKE